MKIKTETAGFLICIVVIAVFAIAAAVVPPEEQQTPTQVNFNNEPAQAKELCSLDTVKCEGETYPISCYTSVESKGANGIEDGVSVATYQFPQGTWIEIEGIGKRRVDTVTSKTYSDRIDVWFGDSYEECLQFGVQERQVWVIN